MQRCWTDSTRNAVDGHVPKLNAEPRSAHDGLPNVRKWDRRLPHGGYWPNASSRHGGGFSRELGNDVPRHAREWCRILWPGPPSRHGGWFHGHGSDVFGQRRSARDGCAMQRVINGKKCSYEKHHPRVPCKFFMNSHCRFGAACPFVHPGASVVGNLCCCVLVTCSSW